MKTICLNCRGSNIEYDPSQGNSFCADCGAVLEENAVVSEVTFAELSSGASVLQGQFVASGKGRVTAPNIFGRRMGPLSGSSSTGSGAENGAAVVSESREITLANGKRRLGAVAAALGLGDHHVEMAHRWFTLALQHQFTRGRRSNNIIASCLYIVCRLERTPHMLLDFSDILQTSVYSLGGTFLRLTQLLNLELPLVDPSFYIGRFASQLEFAEKTQQVVNSALRVSARMKRDWIVTGRRPAGVCAASIIVAARMHGFRRTEKQVVRVVHICEATLKRRLTEFAATPSSQLSLEEFEGIWLEQECDPPSFTAKGRVAAVQAEEADDSSSVSGSEVGILDSETLAEIHRLQTERPEDFDEEDDTGFTQSLFTPPMTPLVQRQAEAVKPVDLSDDNLEDLDEDEDIQTMLLTNEESQAKTIIWSEVNSEFLEAQAEIEKLEKERIAAKGADNEEPAGLSGASVKKPRKKRVKQASNSTQGTLKPLPSGEPVAETAAEAAKKALNSKKLSKKINYDALESLMTNK